jgi:hypothetical protein
VNPQVSFGPVTLAQADACDRELARGPAERHGASQSLLRREPREALDQAALDRRRRIARNPG